MEFAVMETSNFPVSNSVFESRTLKLIERLFMALHERNISYCHWKSNIEIELSLRGDNDLDLLIDRRHGTKFDMVLEELGFKRVISSPQRRFPGIEDFYGLDEASGKLVHVHAHYQLVLGEPLLKNVRLAIEQHVLATARQYGMLWVSAPEYELILFVLRMILRISWIDIIRGRIVSPKVKRELMYLKDQVATNELGKCLDQCRIPPDLFNGLLFVLETGSSGWRLLWLQHRLRGVLQDSIRMGAFRSATSYLLRWGLVLSHLLWKGTVPKKQSAKGGLVIALVGGDGAGKSTLVRELQDWLGGIYEVQTFHIGKPPPTLSSTVVFKLLGLMQRIGVYGRKVNVDGTMSVYNSTWVFQLLELIKSWCTARDRYRTFRAIRKSVSEGSIVLVDRYPLPELRQMDSSFAVKYPVDIHPALQWLERKTEHYYQSITRPDLIVVLKLSPEVAVQRKPDEPPEYVRRRAQEVFEIMHSGRGVVVLDAEQPLIQVVQELKKIVWEWL